LLLCLGLWLNWLGCALMQSCSYHSMELPWQCLFQAKHSIKPPVFVGDIQLVLLSWNTIADNGNLLPYLYSCINIGIVICCISLTGDNITMVHCHHQTPCGRRHHHSCQFSCTLQLKCLHLLPVVTAIFPPTCFYHHESYMDAPYTNFLSFDFSLWERYLLKLCFPWSHLSFIEPNFGAIRLLGAQLHWYNCHLVELPWMYVTFFVKCSTELACLYTQCVSLSLPDMARECCHHEPWQAWMHLLFIHFHSCIHVSSTTMLTYFFPDGSWVTSIRLPDSLSFCIPNGRHPVYRNGFWPQSNKKPYYKFETSTAAFVMI